jgi:hypothetical protein
MTHVPAQAKCFCSYCSTRQTSSALSARREGRGYSRYAVAVKCRRAEMCVAETRRLPALPGAFLARSTPHRPCRSHTTHDYFGRSERQYQGRWHASHKHCAQPRGERGKSAPYHAAPSSRILRSHQLPQPQLRQTAFLCCQTRGHLAWQDMLCCVQPIYLIHNFKCLSDAQQ